MNKKLKNKNTQLTFNKISFGLSIFAILLSIYAIWGTFAVAESDNRNGTGVIQVYKHSSENRKAIESLIECQTTPEMCAKIDWSEPYTGYLVD